jgi:hypothetical protein
MRNPRIKGRIAELTQEHELMARVARTPVAEILVELEKHGLERVVDFYQDGPAGGLVIRDLRGIPVEIALALLNSLHDGFGISWEKPER